jgi:hypothetical protein
LLISNSIEHKASREPEQAGYGAALLRGAVRAKSIVDPPIPHGLVAGLGDVEFRPWRGCDAAYLEVTDFPDEGPRLWLRQRLELEFGQAHADAKPAEFESQNNESDATNLPTLRTRLTRLEASTPKFFVGRPNAARRL